MLKTAKAQPDSRERSPAMQVIEHTEGYYEAQNVEFDRVYRWSPETGGSLRLRREATPHRFRDYCDGCGADHAVVRGELIAGRPGDEALHPWRYTKDREGAGVPY